MNIFLVDDNDAFRKNLRFFIEEHLHHKIIGEADNGQNFLDLKSVSADIILMDINMPELNGLDASKLGIWKNNQLKIIAVSQYKDIADLEQLIGAGIKGFVSKTNLFNDLDNALKAVYNGGYFFPHELDITKDDK